MCSQPYPLSVKPSLDLLHFLRGPVSGPKQPRCLADAVHLFVGYNSDSIPEKSTYTTIPVSDRKLVAGLGEVDPAYPLIIIRGPCHPLQYGPTSAATTAFFSRTRRVCARYIYIDPMSFGALPTVLCARCSTLLRPSHIGPEYRLDHPFQKSLDVMFKPCIS